MNAPLPKIWLAPLRGFTDAVFRNLFAFYFNGIDGAIAPFLTTLNNSKIKPTHLRDILPENNHGMTVIPQILSKSAPDFVVLAKTLADLGYSVVNWNLGCPYPMVTKKGRGAGLLAYPDQVDRFLDEVTNAIPNRLSIKLRLGLKQVDEIDALFPIFNRYPLEELIIHPRTAKQMYAGQPDLTSFATCLAQTTHRVAYNGDIRTRMDYLQLQNRFPTIDTWMIGRGVLVDPFLPGRIKGVAVEGDNEPARLHRFHDALLAAYGEVLYGPGHLLNRMKGFWRYFSEAFENGPEALKRIQKANTLETYRYHVNALITSNHRAPGSTLFQKKDKEYTSTWSVR